MLRSRGAAGTGVLPSAWLGADLALFATAISLISDARQPIGSGLAGGNCTPATSVERDDHLIGTDQPEVLAHQFVRHVRIGLARVEQLRAMAELRALLLQP